MTEEEYLRKRQLYATSEASKEVIDKAIKELDKQWDNQSNTLVEEVNSMTSISMTEIPTELFNQLNYLGLIPSEVRDTHVGKSDYSKQLIQPWTIWLAYPHLTSWDHDIIKRVLRTKSTDSRILDYNKIIHICEERKRQLSFQGGI